MMRRPLAVLAALVVFAAAPVVARAEIEVRLSVKVSDDPKRRGAAPDIEATIIGGPGGVPADKFSLVQTDAKVPVNLKATGLRKYTEGNETIAVVLLVEGHEVWMGNESYAETEEDKYFGVYSKLGPVVDALSKVGPAGSMGAIIVYSQGAEARHPMSPLATMTSDKLGGQKDYQNKTSRDLVTGVNEALSQLRKITTSRKALVVLGDGADTNPNEAKGQLSQLRKAFEQDRIEVYGIQYVAESLDNEGGVVKTLIPDVKVAQSMDGIAASMNAIVERMNDRYYVTFPGHDPRLKAGFSWDGKEHELAVKIDQQELDPATLALVPVWRAPREGGFPWLAVLIPVGLLAVVVVVIKRMSRRPPPPLDLPEVEAPRPVGPLKTVMLGAGGDLEGYPVVGWLVPLGGPQGYQTFRLLQGVTKIGTSSATQVVLQDGFMSTEHCQIVGSPQGFQLQDNKSTNGCYVNDKRVERHDLVDNDVVTLGKTHLVFKSIN
jgi:hypothetical protein